MIFRSPLPDLSIPNVDFSSFVLRRPRQLGEKTALIDGVSGHRISYRELTRGIDAAAGSLGARGLRQGDVVAICGFNEPEYALVAHAVWRARGIVVTVNPLFTVSEMVQELSDAGAHYLVAAPEVIERAAEAGRRCQVREMFSFREVSGVTPFALLARGQRPPPHARINPRDDTALILYSSGTTGLPKGVMLTHRNLMAALYQLESGDLAREEDVLIAVPPFFHIVGLHGILNLGMFAGATIVTLARFELGGFLQAVQDHRVTSAFLTPPVMNELAKHPAVEEYDVSSLRSILCAAAPLSPDIEQACADRLGCIVKQGFGLTEATGPVLMSPNEREHVKRGSVGLCCPSTECKIVDHVTGAELGPNQTGEILARGPQIMKGYLNHPEATAQTIEPDGWLHTGDIGYVDEQGFFYVVDRLKEIIKYKAYQVAPAELEAVLVTHPAVADAAVIPSPDEEAGEVPKALVVLKSPANAAEILSFVAARVAPFKKIRLIEFIETIPKSPSGKILRRILVERERQTRATGGAVPS